jgi:hypothetical protein
LHVTHVRLNFNLRDRSLFIVQGGIEEKLGRPSNFFKPERGGFEKIQRDKRRGALKRFTSLKKTLVVLKMYHKTT